MFEVILYSIQLSQDFKVSNGRPLIGKILVKINRFLILKKAKTSATCILKYKEKVELIFGHSSTLINNGKKSYKIHFKTHDLDKILEREVILILTWQQHLQVSR